MNSDNEEASIEEGSRIIKSIYHESGKLLGQKVKVKPLTKPNNMKRAFLIKMKNENKSNSNNDTRSSSTYKTQYDDYDKIWGLMPNTIHFANIAPVKTPQVKKLIRRNKSDILKCDLRERLHLRRKNNNSSSMLNTNNQHWFNNNSRRKVNFSALNMTHEAIKKNWYQSSYKGDTPHKIYPNEFTKTMKRFDSLLSKEKIGHFFINKLNHSNSNSTFFHNQYQHKPQFSYANECRYNRLEKPMNQRSRSNLANSSIFDNIHLRIATIERGFNQRMIKESLLFHNNEKPDFMKMTLTMIAQWRKHEEIWLNIIDLNCKAECLEKYLIPPNEDECIVSTFLKLYPETYTIEDCINEGLYFMIDIDSIKDPKEEMVKWEKAYKKVIGRWNNDSIQKVIKDLGLNRRRMKLMEVAALVMERTEDVYKRLLEILRRLLKKHKKMSDLKM